MVLIATIKIVDDEEHIFLRDIIPKDDIIKYMGDIYLAYDWDTIPYVSCEMMPFDTEPPLQKQQIDQLQQIYNYAGD